MVVFGGTGDLAFRKLYPAIYNLNLTGLLPEDFALVSVGRRDKTTSELRVEAEESILKFAGEQIRDQKIIKETIDRFYYFKNDFYDNEGYKKLGTFLSELDKKYGTLGNRIFYLAVAPEHFGPVVERIDGAGLISHGEGSWQRVVIEKPFGRDLESAKQLNKAITRVFDEDHIYRIDHYLGKEMLQNIMVIRFANTLFEALWNNKYIDHIQITSSEMVGVENRGGYYEGSGALRDMVQNHMLQLLMLTAMEPPVNLDTQSVRDEKVKVLKALTPMTPDEVARNVVRGQYGPGHDPIDHKEVLGYRSEARVSKDSDTETYVAMKVMVNNIRWAGVPFYLRTGKRMPCRTTEIAIQFSKPPEILYFKEFQNLQSDLLVIKIQPREGAFLQFNAKRPGTRGEIVPVAMDFCQNCEIGSVSADAYERLLYDVLRGDSTLFTRWDEVEHSWKFIDGIADAWAMEQPDFPNYRAGDWGPERARELIENDKRIWRDVCDYY
ncbi:MAG: glucose-6-phosphate dehydrogenase [Clostridiales bacterium]|nr:glucose-6-phosphate dehydrogenase [Clostridiales bacterium]